MNQPPSFNLPRIITELERGNLVITPTDTVYGIIADAENPAAVQKVFAAKHRNPKKPLLLLASDLEMLRACVTRLTPLEEDIVQNFLPGPLTILLPKSPRVSNLITGDSPLIGIRIPDHTDLIAAIRTLGHPLISTSANLAGDPTITNPKNLSPTLLRHIAYVEDAGPIESAPSTLIKVEANEIKILRPGTIAKQLLEHYSRQSHNP